MENKYHVYLGYSGIPNMPQDLATKYNNLLSFLGAEEMVVQLERFLNESEFSDLIESIEDNLAENNIKSPNL
jgi:hypothetical protein